MPSNAYGMGKKILVADDHWGTRKMFSRVLADSHYWTLEACNGEEAYYNAVYQQPDLILLDVMMPVMDGYEALAKSKEDPSTHAIQVIMVTAVDRPLERKLAREWGATGYLVKPVRLDELQRSVGYALAQAA